MSELAKQLYEQQPDLFIQIQVGTLDENAKKKLEEFLKSQESQVSVETLVAEVKTSASVAPARQATASDRAEEKVSQEKQAEQIKEPPVAPVIEPGKPLPKG